MTLYTWAIPRKFPGLPIAEPRYFQVEPGTRILAHCHWQANAAERPTIVGLHGLESSSDAHYLRGLAHKAYAAGFNVIRVNQRNCGGTEHLTETLYHSGLTADPLAILRELIEVDRLSSIAVVGYSLGGNVALRLAGELRTDAPPELKAVCAVSPTIDLAGCVRALERGENAIYQWNFVRNLKRRLRRKARFFPARYDVSHLRRITTVRSFDEIYTAPAFGFRGADDYYYRASALRVIEGIRVPTLIITAEDDPFVPADAFIDPAVTRNPAITTIVPKHGGHCGFRMAASDGFDGYWAERECVDFCARKCREGIYQSG